MRLQVDWVPGRRGYRSSTELVASCRGWGQENRSVAWPWHATHMQYVTHVVVPPIIDALLASRASLLVLRARRGF